MVLFEWDSEDCVRAHGLPRGGWFCVACRLRGGQALHIADVGVLQDNVFRLPACQRDSQMVLVACLQGCLGALQRGRVAWLRSGRLRLSTGSLPADAPDASPLSRLQQLLP